MADVGIYISTKENKTKQKEEQKETLQHHTIPVHLNAAWIPYTVTVNIRHRVFNHMTVLVQRICQYGREPHLLAKRKTAFLIRLITDFTQMKRQRYTKRMISRFYDSISDHSNKD